MTSVFLILTFLLADGTTRTHRWQMPSDEQCVTRGVDVAKRAFAEAPSKATITVACEFVKK